MMRTMALRSLLIAFLLPLLPAPADAIPVFARRYGVSCQLCHNPVPMLTDFGATFAGNGFRMSAAEPPRDTINTGDPLLWLPNDLPLSFRLDSYAQAYAGGNAATDFQGPYTLKILGSGVINRKLSWYVYALLLERGEFGGVEDAYINVNDIGGKELDLMVGQFQLSDPLFKRELRLMFEDYAIYRATIGEEPLNLTYDRGVMALADVGGFTVTAQVVNGNGIGGAQSNRRFDTSPGKTAGFHITRDLIGGVRLGAYGLYGHNTSNGVRNKTTMVGADASLGRGPVELNLQYIHREDDDPLFQGQGATLVKTDGGFAELLVRPAGSRWFGFGLYNIVVADRPYLDVRLGGPSGVRRYETASAGIGYLVMRNFRLSAEGTWDMEQERTRWSLGIVTAF
ncbi:MAG: hypothetical protein ABR551_08530 [Gemmatimonadales bacterium]